MYDLSLPIFYSKPNPQLDLNYFWANSIHSNKSCSYHVHKIYLHLLFKPNPDFLKQKIALEDKHFLTFPLDIFVISAMLIFSQLSKSVHLFFLVILLPNCLAYSINNWISVLKIAHLGVKLKFKPLLRKF